MWEKLKKRQQQPKQPVLLKHVKKEPENDKRLFSLEPEFLSGEETRNSSQVICELASEYQDNQGGDNICSFHLLLQRLSDLAGWKRNI